MYTCLIIWKFTNFTKIYQLNNVFIVCWWVLEWTDSFYKSYTYFLIILSVAWSGIAQNTQVDLLFLVEYQFVWVLWLQVNHQFKWSTYYKFYIDFVCRDRQNHRFKYPRKMQVFITHANKWTQSTIVSKSRSLLAIWNYLNVNIKNAN